MPVKRVGCLCGQKLARKVAASNQDATSCPQERGPPVSERKWGVWENVGQKTCRLDLQGSLETLRTL